VVQRSPRTRHLLRLTSPAGLARRVSTFPTRPRGYSQVPTQAPRGDELRAHELAHLGGAAVTFAAAHVFCRARSARFDAPDAASRRQSSAYASFSSATSSGHAVAHLPTAAISAGPAHCWSYVSGPGSLVARRRPRRGLEATVKCPRKVLLSDELRARLLAPLNRVASCVSDALCWGLPQGRAHFYSRRASNRRCSCVSLWSAQGQAR
jgi:hypothetical protein